MAKLNRVLYLCVAKVDGQTRVLNVRGTQDEADTKAKVQAINPKMEILTFRRATPEEISAEGEKVRADPDYVPSSMEEIAAAGRPPAPDVDPDAV